MKGFYFELWFEHLYTLPKWKLTLLALASMFIVLILEFISVFGDLSNAESSDYTTVKMLFVGFVAPVVIAPILETLFFQTLFFRIGKKASLSNRYVIIISSFIFALAHKLNLIDIVFFFLRGIVLNGHYLILKNRQEKAFWQTCLLHATYNFIVVTPYWGIVCYEKLCGKIT